VAPRVPAPEVTDAQHRWRRSAAMRRRQYHVAEKRTAGANEVGEPQYLSSAGGQGRPPRTLWLMARLGLRRSNVARAATATVTATREL